MAIAEAVGVVGAVVGVAGAGVGMAGAPDGVGEQPAISKIPTNSEANLRIRVSLSSEWMREDATRAATVPGCR